jgi:hypothetical protein
MAYGTVEIMTVDAYRGLRGGGIGLAIVSSVGMAVILTLNTAGAAHIPTGWAALAATGMMVSPVLFLGGKILRKLDDLLERESGVRVLATHRDVARGTEHAGTEDARERQAYANGAVDLLDGQAVVLPINGYRPRTTRLDQVREP